MLAYESKKEFFITTKKDDINIDDVMHLFKFTHWACNRAKDVVEKSIANSMCFGVYDGDTLVAFARVISDHTTFGYISDVIVDPVCRGQQIGQWLINSILNHTDLKEVPQWRLKTTNAHSFYKALGFEELKHPDKHLELCGEY